MSLISEDDFREKWGVMLAKNDDFFFHDEVAGCPLNHVWTVVESGEDDDGSWYAIPGFHIVNKLGYVITEKRWDDESQDAIYFLDDFDDEPLS